jgi:hypothetical protein
MSNASQRGSCFIGRHPDLSYFDRLPRLHAGRSPTQCSIGLPGLSTGAWRRGKHGFKTGADLAARVAEADARQIAKDRKRVWGVK